MYFFKKSASSYKLFASTLPRWVTWLTQVRGVLRKQMTGKSATHINHQHKKMPLRSSCQCACKWINNSSKYYAKQCGWQNCTLWNAFATPIFLDLTPFQVTWVKTRQLMQIAFALSELKTLEILLYQMPGLHLIKRNKDLV